MPLDLISDEVNERWKVDVNTSCMYRARRKGGKKILWQIGVSI
jgi:hypothetical protein